MPTPASRLIVPPLISASRTAPRFTKAPLVRNQTPAQAAGRAYEAKVTKSLSRLHGWTLQHNPWFSYLDNLGNGLCSPDILLFTNGPKPQVLVIEVKRTWVPEAVIKLQRLYVPVIQRTLGVQIRTAIICKTLVPDVIADTMIDRLSMAILAPRRHIVPTLLWLGQGDIPW